MLHKVNDLLEISCIVRSITELYCHY
uniref:Uncharacterized protein n=1 Tax=Rhizophora mucronata TaxID=61149 RepID=A0A2P2PZ07_RHIMU